MSSPLHVPALVLEHDEQQLFAAESPNDEWYELPLVEELRESPMEELRV
jgi:hypothetical protein